jgi:succinoglycan biosynthesis protein ExoM
VTPLEDHEIGIVVVDNAASASAAGVVERFRGASRFALSYLREMRRGEPFARNAAIAHAHSAKHYVFIDDDEEPQPRWLASLYAARCRTGAEMVCGAVVQRLPCEPPAWYRRGGYGAGSAGVGQVDRRRLRMSGGAGNLLVSRKVFERLGAEPFPTQFPLSGGSDHEMLMRAALAGFRLAAAPDAIVTELVPAERLRAGYVLRRGYGGGHTHMRMLRRHARRSAGWAAALRAVAGLGFWGTLGLAAAWSPSHAVGFAHRASIHLGRLAAFLGRPPAQRYRVTDGS